MRIFFLLISSLSITIFVNSGCKKNEVLSNISPAPLPALVNKPPGQFNITLAESSWDTAKVSWTKSIDPDNDSIFYKVYLNDTLKITDYKQQTYTFRNLTQLTTYILKVVAVDTKQKETISIYNLTTKEYKLKFLKKLEYGLISGYSTQQLGQMIKAIDGGYVMVGKTELLSAPNNIKFFILKIDTLGNELWKKYYNYSPGNTYAMRITKCNDGYLVNGEKSILKVDINGNFLWTKSTTDYEYINGIAVNSMNQIYSVGWVASDSSTNVVEASISKYETNGNLIWNKRFSPTIRDEFDDIKINANGELIVLGNTDGNNITIQQYQNNTAYINADFWVLNLSSEGNIIWNKSYHDNGTAFAKNIIKTTEGNYVFTGFSFVTPGVPYFYLQMIDGLGNSLWRYYSNTNTTMGFSVSETNDNALIVAGGFKNYYDTDFALYKFDKNGNQLWNKQYSEFATSMINRTGIPTADGGYIINSQKSKIYNTGNDRDQIYIFKTDALGNFN